MKIKLILFFILLSTFIFANTDEEYNYPIKDRYMSTIIGTPDGYQYPITRVPKVKHYQLENFNKKEIPDVFWYQHNYEYSICAQPGKAPLAFVLPGVGGFYDGGHTLEMRNVLYDAGYHVIALSNPSHPSFLISASSTGIIGLIERDVSDLYAVMKAIYIEAEKELDIDGNYMVGYSLGATYSAFLGKQDSEENFFNFKKIFMINPSVNLLDSALLFDNLVDSSLPNGISDVNKFMDEVEELLLELPYELDTSHLQKNAQYFLEKNPSPELYKKIVGLLFRNTVSNIVFVSDVMNDMGEIVPVGTELDKFSSLTEYYKKSNNYGFFEYFTNFLLVYLKKKNLDYSFEELLSLSSLTKIEDFLKTADNIQVVTNRDELILTENDFSFLEETFKARIHIYPIGGHCGNLNYKENVEYMLDVLAGKI